jgi:hypothetical protein
MTALGALVSIVLSSLCSSGSLLLGRTTKPESLCTTNNAPAGWLTFVDRRHRFCFQYPPEYASKTKLGFKPYLLPDTKLLAILHNAEPRGFNKKGEWTSASITVLFSNAPCTLEYMLHYAPNGPEAPSEVQVGSHTFYEWGAGGGGVDYPDVYHFNLHGHTLTLIFSGPYTEGSKSPDQRTQEIEKKILASLKTF